MNGTFNFTSGTFYMALYTNAATLDATTTAYTSTGEVVASGYTAGGLALTIAQVPTVGNSGTTAYISFDNAVWTSSLTARGALIYQTTTGNPAVCVLDFGADKTSSATFTVQFPDPSNTSAIIRLA
jgi:O-acetylhomoserine/O-acetylserine sulfhydrylase-like pyridoxal-dependent enzyme